MQKHRNLTALGLLLPLMIGIIGFFLIPFVILIYYSFTFGVGGEEFVGFSNYISIMKSEAFRSAFLNTGKFLSIGVSLNMVLSFLVALMIQRHFSGSKLFRSVILFPMFLPVAAVVTVFSLFFSDVGLINSALQSLGLVPKEWLQSDSAFSLVLGLYIIKSIGYNVILFLAGLNMIPKELYETADIEGAGGLRKVFNITIPLVSPTTYFVFIISIMNCFKSFREVFILGGDHPHASIYMLPHFINNNIKNLNYPRLAVATLITIFVIAIVAAIFYIRESRMEERL